eukprot:TRINITY_DN47989_c0_g1_i1.p1 TRINITY_DN47989_c0_g1~~TRINITY_DN47989_c0_g1_i1.p1  ORF type:complete len:213 (+),score=61.88 TRINITY_DN47989_c0_g1_i1:53-691(+)
MRGQVAAVVMLVAVAAAAKQRKGPAWRTAVGAADVQRRLQCSACRMTLGDAGAHIQILRESRMDRIDQKEVDGIFENLCVNAEMQFWALKWKEDGPAELEFKRRYDIHQEETATREAEVVLGLRDAPKDPTDQATDGGYWGNDEQRTWARDFYLAKCNAVLDGIRDTLLPWALSGEGGPEFPAACPFECESPSGPKRGAAEGGGGSGGGDEL